MRYVKILADDIYFRDCCFDILNQLVRCLQWKLVRFIISLSHDTDQNVTYLVKRCPKKNGYLLTTKVPKAFQTSTEYFEVDRFQKFYVREHNVVFEVTKIRRNGTVVRAQRIKVFVGHVT
ncbi:unnamed protein product [Clavelina lepadiformis]|uniref:Uncharacterized protein n=1 Tax=Clavelina lepadiformis TaxID=159417 RepID=A0ABP0GVP0_CLALP